MILTSKIYPKMKHFVPAMILIPFVICWEGGAGSQCDQTNVVNNYVNDMRSISDLPDLNILSDFSIINGNILFHSHRVILAARSRYFKELFKDEPTKKYIKLEESSEYVKDILNFIMNGCIPGDIDDKAVDLLPMSVKYGLDDLTKASEASLVKNLTPENAIETLIILEKVKHASRLEYRHKILTFMTEEITEIVKTPEWENFVQEYPNLVTEIVLSLANTNRRTLEIPNCNCDSETNW